MALHPIALIGAACAALYLLVYCYHPVSSAKSFIKTSSVLALAAMAHLSGGPVLLVCALALCALGDYLLSLDKDTAFMGGVGAFAAGHVAYIALFLSHSASQPELLFNIPALLAVGVLIVLAIAMSLVLAPRAGDLKIPVMIYIPIIVGMGISALTFSPNSLVWLAIPGALLFVMSDFVLSLEMFVYPEDHPARRYTPFVVWTTYWSAQFLLLFAFLA